MRTNCNRHCDLLVIGGGINGAGIARDAAGRGLSVLLAERDDLAAHTSSASTKLIHGGLRYLESYEFGLVRKSLAERELLLRQAPHIMWPLRFVLPHEPHLRPAWTIRAGLFLYDHLAHRSWLPASRGVDLRRHPAGAALRPDLTRGFEYSDGWADDARLVLLCARDAADRGATVLTRTACVAAARDRHGWIATLRGADAVPFTVRARAIVNATGPWAHQILAKVLGQREAPRLRLVRGSHVVVRAQFAHPYAYIFQNADRRIVFAIPYEHDFTLIGTTEVEVEDLADEHASEDEIAYLLAAASHYFARPIAARDVVHRFAGVRPLVDEQGSASSVTRDYRLQLDAEGAPLLTVFGGKITTFRRLAEEVLALLEPALGGSRAPWTQASPLPGGDMDAMTGDPQRAFEAWVARLLAEHPAAEPTMVRRLARLYGTHARRMLERPGAHLVADVCEAELEHAWNREWARSADDFLWRRTKLGLHLDGAAQARIRAWFAQCATLSDAREPRGPLSARRSAGAAAGRRR